MILLNWKLRGTEVVQGNRKHEHSSDLETDLSSLQVVNGDRKLLYLSNSPTLAFFFAVPLLIFSKTC